MPAGGRWQEPNVDVNADVRMEVEAFNSSSRYDRDDLARALSGKKWISPHRKVVAVVDERASVVELVEEHARGTCLGGSAWSLYHYTKNSRDVFWSKREGPRIFYKLRLSGGEGGERAAQAGGGNKATDLVPSYVPAAIDSVSLAGDEVRVTYSGLAGAGVAALSRGLAEGVEGIEVAEWGGGKKLGRATIVLPRKEKVILGVDDTDKADEGATWALVNELALEAAAGHAGVDYLEHAIVQLFPQNPYKTQNCVAVSVSFAVPPGLTRALVKDFKDRLAECTLSKETGMACFSGVMVPEGLKGYARRAKSGMVSVEDARVAAGEHGVGLCRVTGDRGLIGAVASIPYVETPDEAVRLGE